MSFSMTSLEIKGSRSDRSGFHWNTCAIYHRNATLASGQGLPLCDGRLRGARIRVKKLWKNREPDFGNGEYEREVIWTASVNGKHSFPSTAGFQYGAIGRFMITYPSSRQDGTDFWPFLSSLYFFLGRNILQPQCKKSFAQFFMALCRFIKTLLRGIQRYPSLPRFLLDKLRRILD